MAHYFFNLHECGKGTLDPLGMECASVDAARVEALRAAREVMCAEVNEGRLCLSCHLEVLDAQGAQVLFLPFREALEITGI